MVLGPVQLAILAFIRKHSQEEGKVEYEIIKAWARNTLGIRSDDQVFITIQRLTNKELIIDKRCGLLAYKNIAKNELEFSRQLTIAKLIVSLAD